MWAEHDQQDVMTLPVEAGRKREREIPVNHAWENARCLSGACTKRGDESTLIDESEEFLHQHISRVEEPTMSLLGKTRPALRKEEKSWQGT